MKILVTGASGGIGRAIADKFLREGHEVFGIDLLPAPFSRKRYTHFVADITKELPEITGVEILVNNAGVQNSGKDIDVNLKGTVRVTEKYGVAPPIKSVVFIASASATTGAEFPEYAASKGGTVAYMKNVALRIARFGATANSLSPGGVTTELNRHVMESEEMWGEIMALTPLKKWASPEEIAEWTYFLAVKNRSMTGQDLIVDNGESTDAKFIW